MRQKALQASLTYPLYATLGFHAPCTHRGHRDQTPRMRQKALQAQLTYPLYATLGFHAPCTQPRGNGFEPGCLACNE
jgi:hypothetical protein